jgi:hypothetical protein
MGCDATRNGAAIELPEAVDPGMDISLEHFHAYMPQHNTSSRRRGDVAAEERQFRDRAIADHRQRPAGARRQGQAPGSCRASAWLDKRKPVEQMTWAPGMPALIRGRLMFEGGWFDLAAAACFNLYRPSARPAIPTRRRRQGSLAGADQAHGPRMEFDVG